MQFQIFHDNPPKNLQDLMEAFEKQFQYPLGNNLTFTISHPEHYLNFYLAMGEATCVIAKDDKGVQGIVCAAIRRLISPIASFERTVAYVGDLKVSPQYQGQGISINLLNHLIKTGYHKDMAAISVVMDGTKSTPSQYTGRAGIPPFSKISSIIILQFKAKVFLSEHVTKASWDEGMKLFPFIYNKAYFPPHNIALRAKNGGIWLKIGNKACALLEDTILAKRLYLSNGKEMVNAHLSYLAYHDPKDAIAIIKYALKIACSQNYEALFLAVTPNEHAMLNEYLDELILLQKSTATIYGTQNMKELDFNINTSEI